MRHDVSEFLLKSQENFKLYEHLKEQNIFVGWQIVAIFYSALCYAKAYLYNKNIEENTINNHDSIKNWLRVEKDAKLANVLRYYEPLYRDSRDARYTAKNISPLRIKKALENYNKVKELLKIN